MQWVYVMNSLVFGEFYYRSQCKVKNPPARQKSPTLTRQVAIERAKNYLRIFKIDVPPNYKLHDVEFNRNWISCWDVSWWRYSGKYPWDCYGGGTAVSENVDVGFHEKDGLLLVRSRGCCPEPKSLEVKISKAEAIAKATRCVPLLQKTPIYRSALRDGFVVKKVLWCELMVSVPNWWLDPERAVDDPQGPPSETRLCWKVEFETKDSKEDERRRKGELGPDMSLAAPEMTIYIDAATGEAVGAGANTM